jgi:hypothetical protein
MVTNAHSVEIDFVSQLLPLCNGGLGEALNNTPP